MIPVTKKRLVVLRSNVRLARSLWGVLPRVTLDSLKQLTEKYGLSVGAGDLMLLNCAWYITHAGLLRIAQRRRCHGIKTSLQKDVSDTTAKRWVFKATAYKTPSSRGFV